MANIREVYATMFRKFTAALLAGTTILALSGAAMAQSSSSQSGSNSAAGANSGSSSGASIVYNQGSVPASQSLSTGGGTANWNNNSGDVTVRTTPTVYAPPVSGGNPCTLAVSGGVSVIGWGASAGGTFVDQDCANRQKIAMVHNAGYQGAAKELMCNDKDTYMAFRGSGAPCNFRAAFEPAQGPATLPTQRPPMVVTPVIAPAAALPGRQVCLNRAGREVSANTPGASCGNVF